MTIWEFITIVSYTLAIFMAGVAYGKKEKK